MRWYLVIILSLALVSADVVNAAEDWRCVSHPYTHYTLQNLKSAGNGIMFCNDVSRLFRSIDNGSSWTPLTSIHVRGTFYYDMPGVILYIDSTQVLRSTDLGDTWSEGILPSTNQLIDRIIAHNQSLYMIIRNVIYSSSDSGLHWHKRITRRSNGISDVRVLENGTLVILDRDDFVIDIITGVDSTYERRRVAGKFELSQSSRLVGLYHAGGDSLVILVHDGRILRSTDFGHTWSVGMERFSSNIYTWHDKQIVFSGASDSIFTTSDDGWTWTYWGRSLNLSTNIVLSGDTIISAGMGAAIARSTDRGNVWTYINQPYVPHSENIQTLEGGQLFPDGRAFVWSKETVARTLDGGATWQWMKHPMDGVPKGVGFSGWDTVIISYGGSDIHITTDFGTTWVVQHTDTLHRILSLHAITSRHWIYLVTTVKHPFITKHAVTFDAGVTWSYQPVSDGTWYGEGYPTEMWDENNGVTLNRLTCPHFTYDGGRSWNKSECPDPDNVVSFDVVSPDYAWLTRREASPLRSTDSCRTWQEYAITDLDTGGVIGFVDESTGYIFNPGQRKTTDGGLTWYKVNSHLRGAHRMYTTGNRAMVIVGMGIYMLGDFSTTSVKMPASNTHIRLYPNPVTDVVAISSTMPFTSASVYNTMGVEVLTASFASTTSAKLQVAGLLHGNYIIRVLGGQGYRSAIMQISR